MIRIWLLIIGCAFCFAFPAASASAKIFQSTWLDRAAVRIFSMAEPEQ
jgi:hypothetical protein